MDVFDTSSTDSDSNCPTDRPAAAGVLLDAPPELTSPRPAANDATAWRAWLEECGFSRAEASRLIFERLRPRDEGTARVSPV